MDLRQVVQEETPPEITQDIAFFDSI